MPSAVKKAIQTVAATRGVTSLAEELRAIGKHPVYMLSEHERLMGVVREWVPTGILPLDYAICGGGGIPVGRAIEVGAPPGWGKSSLLYHVAGAFQRYVDRDGRKGEAIILDVERGMSPPRIIAMGADDTRLFVYEPDSVESVFEILQIVLDVADKGNQGPILIGWDSLGATSPRRENEEGLVAKGKKVKAKKADKPDVDSDDEDDEGESDGAKKNSDGSGGMTLRPRLVARALRVAGPRLARARATFWVNNQMIANVAPFGAPLKTPTPNALWHLESLKLESYSPGTVLKEGDRAIAKLMKVKASKNKLGPEQIEFMLKHTFGKGFDLDWTLLEYAKDRGVLEPGAKRSRDNVERARQGLGWAR